VKAARLVISHAIPPQARLTASPCSVNVKSLGSKASTRYTYAACRNELRAKREQILGFAHVDSRSSPSSDTPDPTSKQYTWDSEKDVSPIIHLEAVSAGSTHEVIVVHENGTVRGLSAHLVEQLWTTSIAKGNTVEFAFVQTAGEARQGILKHRADLLAFANTGDQTTDHVEQQKSIISLVTYNQKDSKRTLRIVAVQALTAASAVQLTDRVQPLIDWPLPRFTQGSDVKPKFSFDIASATLLHFNKGLLSTLDFTTLGPHLLHQLPHSLESAMIASFLPLPQSRALVTTPENCRLVNTQYNSILASCATTLSDATTRPNKKRKHSETDIGSSSTASPVVLLDYFRSLNLAVAIQHDSLIAFQLRLPEAMAGRRTQASRIKSRLIESIGRGIPSTAEGVRHAPSAIDAKKVDELARSDASLTTLADVFTRAGPSSYVSLDGLVQSLRWILRSFSTPGVPDQPRLAAPEEPSPKKAKVNGVNGVHPPEPDTLQTETALDSDLLAEEAAAESDLSLAIALITSTPTSSSHSDNKRAETLHTLLTRLGTCHPSSSLSSTFRSLLSRHDLFLLIELLRHALEQGGWTSKTLDVYPTGDDTDPDTGGLDSSISVIGTLLSCAVDALGTGAWLTGGIDVSVDSTFSASPSPSSAGDDAMDMDIDLELDAATTQRPLLPTLRHLTASALEVTQEAAFFRAFLADFLRYADTLAEAPNRGAGGGIDKSGSGGSMLPMGVRHARGISATRVAAGGEVKVRSRRDVAERAQREVGRYGFERLRV